MLKLRKIIVLLIAVLGGCATQDADPYGLREGLERHKDYAKSIKYLEDDYRSEVSKTLPTIDQELTDEANYEIQTNKRDQKN